MSVNTENIEQLVFKFNTGTISPAELQLLQDWYNSHNDAAVTISTKADESEDQVKSRMLESLLTRIAEDQSKPVKQKRLWPRIAVAAAALTAIVFGLWFYTYRPIVNPNTQITSQNDIQAGGNKATLTLQDGRDITLSNSQTGIVTGDEITYTNGTPVENTGLDERSEVQKLTLHTPRGGTYTITLQDGTQVWLNAASILKYPSRFGTAARVVELEGEAYFKVKPTYNEKGGKVPFKVISAQQEVEVLGTQFNMNTYVNQPFSKTTLVEGKVAISDQSGNFTLAPGEQATTLAGKTKVKKVEVDNYTAWRDGKFSFDGKTFEENMNDIARWYDLHVVYENGIPEEELTGDAYRNQNIRFVLRFLRSAEIDYKLDVANRKLTIKGKNNRM
jgi:transmembrane sensor